MRKNWKRKRAVVISPDKASGLLIRNDAEPNFDLITFNYDSSDLDVQLMWGMESKCHYAFESEFWGESFFKLCGLIDESYEVVCFMNSDLFVGVSSLNEFFDTNDLFGLDFSQPSLGANSYFSHPHTVNIPGACAVQVPFIEIMMPCLSREVINEINRLGLYTISGWGLDVDLFPFIQRKLKLKAPAVVHTCQVIHSKSVSSGGVKYSDGLTAREQMEKLREAIALLPK